MRVACFFIKFALDFRLGIGKEVNLALWLNWIEHQTSDLRVVGSSPARVTKRGLSFY